MSELKVVKHGRLDEYSTADLAGYIQKNAPFDAGTIQDPLGDGWLDQGATRDALTFENGTVQAVAVFSNDPPRASHVKDIEKRFYLRSLGDASPEELAELAEEAHRLYLETAMGERTCAFVTGSRERQTLQKASYYPLGNSLKFMVRLGD